MVYDGGVLSSGDVVAITLQDGELAGYEFVEPGKVAERVSPNPTTDPTVDAEGVLSRHSACLRRAQDGERGSG
jgi:hypothetical protein